MSVPKPLLLASLSSLLVAGLCIWGWVLHPEHAGRFAFRMFFLPALWGFIEYRMSSADVSRRSVREILRWHRSVFAWVGLIIAVGVGAQVAISAGVLDAEWAPTARRLSGVLFGAGTAIWGNYLPKVLSPWSTDEQPFDWQRVHRFGGWAFSLGGVAIVLVWLTLPVDMARLASGGIAIAVGVAGVGRKFMSVAAYARRQPPPARVSTSSQGWQ